MFVLEMEDRYVSFEFFFAFVDEDIGTWRMETRAKLLRHKQLGISLMVCRTRHHPRLLQPLYWR